MAQTFEVFRHLRQYIAALLAAIIAATSFAVPALGDTAGQRSTRNIVLGGLAAAVAIILYNNYEHKRAAANTVVGYTRDGGVVYADGRIAYPDGTVLYTGNRQRQHCRYDGYGVPCNRQTYAYYPYGRHRHGHGHGDGDDRHDDGNNGNHGDDGNNGDNGGDGGD